MICPPSRNSIVSRTKHCSVTKMGDTNVMESRVPVTGSNSALTGIVHVLQTAGIWAMGGCFPSNGRWVGWLVGLPITRFGYGDPARMQLLQGDGSQSSQV